MPQSPISEIGSMTICIQRCTDDTQALDHTQHAGTCGYIETEQELEKELELTSNISLLDLTDNKLLWASAKIVLIFPTVKLMFPGERLPPINSSGLHKNSSLGVLHSM